MSVRVLLLAQDDQSGDTGHEPRCLQFSEAIESAGWESDVVTLPPAGAEPKFDGVSTLGGGGTGEATGRGSRAGSVSLARRSVRFGRRSVRKLIGIVAGKRAARAAHSVWKRVQLSVLGGPILRAAESACRHFLPNGDVPNQMLTDRAYAESVWAWNAGVISATYSLPARMLTHSSVMAAVIGALRAHGEEPFDVVVIVAPTARSAAVGYVLSRILQIPLVVDEGWSADPAFTLPSPARVLRDRVSIHASGCIGAIAHNAEPDAVVGLSRVTAQIAEAIATYERRVGGYSSVRPVVSALIEADADIEALLCSIRALQASTLPNWEALVVVDDGDPQLAARVRSALGARSDSRVRVVEAVFESFELYSADVQNAARADYLIRISPGFEVRKDFVARAARTVLDVNPAEGYYWTGARHSSSGACRSCDRPLHPFRLSLHDIAKWWYLLDGEYVMSWRMFRLHGGFSHLTAGAHTREIEQIVLCEAAALSGILFQAEVPLAYRRMAALSRKMAAQEDLPGQECRDASPTFLSDEFIEDSDLRDSLKQRYAGKTVAFVRHTLVSYDARLLKEASTIASLGARVVVAGVSASVPESLHDHGFEVISVSDKDELETVCVRLGERRPDVVHAYDVLSYDLLEPVFRDASIRLVYECRDLLVAPGYLTEDRRIEEFARERRIVNRADAVIAVSEPSAQWIEDAHGIDGVVSILHGATTVLREPTPAHDPVRLLFQGALRPNRGLFALITVMPRFKGRATLTFQSFGVMENAIREYLGQQGLAEAVHFLPVCGPLEVAQHAAQFDIGIICYAGSTENLRRTTPNKLLDYMSAGLALVAPDLPGMHGLADEANGVFFEPGSGHSLAEAIEELISDRELLARRKAASRERALQHRWSLEQRKLVGVYDAVFGIDPSSATFN